MTDSDILQTTLQNAHCWTQSFVTSKFVCSEALNATFSNASYWKKKKNDVLFEFEFYSGGYGSKQFINISSGDGLLLNWCLIQGIDYLGGRFKKTYELLNLRALKISPVNKIHIFQCMGKIFCVEFQRVPLKFHTKYLTHTLKDTIFIQHWNFKSS